MDGMEKKTVALIDDHHIMRSGLKLFIDYLPGFEVVGEASDGDEVMDLLERCHVDILVTDVSMKRLSGLDIIDRVKAQYPDTDVVVLSMHNDRFTVRKAFEQGASAYVVKYSTESEMQQALQAVAEGRRYVSPEVAGELFSEMVTAPEEKPAPGESLTDRQQEILKMVALGKGSKEIAYELGVSVKTVESHRSQIMERLAIRDVPTLVRYAIRKGLIDLDEGF